MVRGGKSEPLKIQLVWGSVWERNCKDLQREMMEFRCGLCGGRGGSSEPLNIHLMWGSVWERNCEDLQRKMMDFRCRLCGGKIRNC